MNNDKKPASVGFHGLIGNDYISLIFRKSKKAGWKLLEKNINYENFSFLGALASLVTLCLDFKKRICVH